MDELGGEENVTGGSGVSEGSVDGPCVLCDAATSVIVECDTQVILIRHGAASSGCEVLHFNRRMFWISVSIT